MECGRREFREPDLKRIAHGFSFGVLTTLFVLQTGQTRSRHRGLMVMAGAFAINQAR
jgi:hypothetical protein